MTSDVCGGDPVGGYLDELFGLRGKVVAITGGGGVLFRTVGRALARAGAEVAVLDLSGPAAESAAVDIAAEGGRALALTCDALCRSSLEEAAGQVLGEFGHIDVLINGAGGNRAEATTASERSFFDLPEEAFRWVFDLNLVATVQASQVFGRAMKERGEGVILNVSSMNAFRPLTRIPAYSAAKAAVSNFTQWLAVHMAQEYSARIRVNALAPGFFLTDQNRYLLTDRGTGELTPRGARIVEHTPAARFGDPEDLVAPTLFLLSDAARFVTGVVLPVDGGFSAYSGV
ncbi:MAG: SDR family oxidoreductase [Anaerolineae bacterium]|nr:SDR family oxidoreductase [Anaerolineae bacterium]